MLLDGLPVEARFPGGLPLLARPVVLALKAAPCSLDSQPHTFTKGPPTSSPKVRPALVPPRDLTSPMLVVTSKLHMYVRSDSDELVLLAHSSMCPRELAVAHLSTTTR